MVDDGSILLHVKFAKPVATTALIASNVLQIKLKMGFVFLAVRYFMRVIMQNRLYETKILNAVRIARFLKYSKIVSDILSKYICF